ncbi:ChuX/HutX family heme-like substrate-binding protein [Thioclava sp. GXIMD4215]|uniref:hemin-degrading factor n=1 Tax=Thioclava sp. GXIMD4215 TaxID=3131928 RepID=UPI00311ADD8A
MRTVQSIRDFRKASGKRQRDMAAELGLSEAAFVAAHIGAALDVPGDYAASPITAHPDEVMPLLPDLGEVMTLTRNGSCVHERVGRFGTYKAGPHAAMVLGREIDTRIFPKYWAYGFAVTELRPEGPRRSLQFYDLYGEALQKIYLLAQSQLAAWQPLVDRLRLPDPATELAPLPLPAPEGPKGDPAKRPALIAGWQEMTDTHQFNRLTHRLGMNRLGAYRMAGHPFVRAVDPASVGGWLRDLSMAGQKVIFFVGNRGHIQIHWGAIRTVRPLGPWLNVLDERFNLHLRGDHIAECYVVEKPTRRGLAVSLEAFDAAGELIFQCFGERESDSDDLAQWHHLLDALPSCSAEAAE